MLALRKTAPGFGLALGDVPPAHPPGPGEVVLEVEAAGICGSDVHAYEWTDGYGFMEPHLPVVMGHECAGRIARTGTGSGFGMEDAIAFAGVSKYPARVKCALLGWKAWKDAVTQAVETAQPSTGESS